MSEINSFRKRITLNTILLSAMSLPMLVLYAMSSLGPLLVKAIPIAPGQLGFIILGSFGIASVLSLFAGNLVNRSGSRHALLILFLVVALAFSIMILVPNLWGLITAALLCGVAQAIANPVTNLLITQKVAASNKAFVVGLKQSGVQVAALFAGSILPLIALRFGWQIALSVIIPLALIMTLISLTLTPEKPLPATKQWKISLPNQYLQRLMLIQCCVGIALSAFVTFIPLFANQHNLSKALSGSLIALFGIMGIVSRIILTPASTKLQDESALLALLSMLAAISMLLLLTVNSTQHWAIWAATIGMGLTAVATNAIAMGMIIRSDCFGAVTTASGLLSVAFFGGFAIGPAIMGSIINTGLGYSFGWPLMAGFLLLASMISITLIRLRKSSYRIA